MKGVYTFLVFVLGSIIGYMLFDIIDMNGDATLESIPAVVTDQKYELNVTGAKPIVYEFDTLSDPNIRCIFVYVGSTYKGGLQCYPKDYETKDDRDNKMLEFFHRQQQIIDEGDFK